MMKELKIASLKLPLLMFELNVHVVTDRENRQPKAMQALRNIKDCCIVASHHLQSMG
jgi:hypothetical protein